MADNAQKLPLGRSLNQLAVRTVLEHIQNMSGRAPATLMKASDKTNTIWKIKFDTDSTYTLPQIDVPVHGSEFQRVPYQEGAKGFVSIADLAISAMTGLGSTSGPASFTRPGNLSNLLWHPVGNTKFKDALDPDAHETYGASGGTITHDGTGKSLVKTHKDTGTSVSSGGDGSGAPGPHAMTTHPTDGTSIVTTAAHTLGATNASLDKDGNQTNEGKSTTKGDVSSTSGNISAAAGMVSGLVGSFASGSIGGFNLSGGSMGGGGSSGLMITQELVAAPTLQTNLPYTVASLNTALPPSTALTGMRAYVTDALSPGFLATLAGGGTKIVPAFCDGTNWVCA